MDVKISPHLQRAFMEDIEKTIISSKLSNYIDRLRTKALLSTDYDEEGKLYEFKVVAPFLNAKGQNALKDCCYAGNIYKVLLLLDKHIKTFAPSVEYLRDKFNYVIFHLDVQNYFPGRCINTTDLGINFVVNGDRNERIAENIIFVLISTYLDGDNPILKRI